MLRFKEFLSEDDSPVLSTQREVKANLDDPCTIDELNRYLIQVTGQRFNNPYSILQAVSKTLSTYGIVLPQLGYMPEPCGEQVFEIEQWGMHPGYAHNFNDRKDGIQTNPGIVPYQNVRSAPETNSEVLYVYLCWDMNEDGVYDAFCMVIDREGLDTIKSANESVNEAKGWKAHTKSAAKAWGTTKGVGNPEEIERLTGKKPALTKAKNNDTVFKNWRKEVGTDYQTTKKIVGEDVDKEAEEKYKSGKVYRYMNKVDAVESLYKSARKEHPVKTVVNRTLRDFGLKK